jgi:hypothetical protein
MGPAGLTAVFGMGTGVTPPVWSPEMPPAGCHATPAAFPLLVSMVDHTLIFGWFTATPLSKASRARSHLTSDQNLNQNPESMSDASSSMPDSECQRSDATLQRSLAICHRLSVMGHWFFAIDGSDR